MNAEGFVLDHLSCAAVDDHLKIVGDRLMQAFGDTPPYAVFSDSLEVYGTDWTDDLLPEFARRRGYDLTQYLPELASGSDEISAEVRHDWGLTLTELVDERYLTPVNEWAKAHGTRLSIADLWDARGVDVQQQAGGAAGGGRAAVEQVFVHSVGDFGEPSLWPADYFGGDMDVASLASVSRDAARYEG